MFFCIFRRTSLRLTSKPSCRQSPTSSPSKILTQVTGPQRPCHFAKFADTPSTDQKISYSKLAALLLSFWSVFTPPIRWCHGAPGIIPLLSILVQLHTTTSSTLSIAPDLLHAILDSMRKASTLVMTAGLLRKGPGLCHGVAGNASALLSAADALSAYHHFRIKLSSTATGVETEDYAALARECTAGALNLLSCYIALDVTVSTNVTTTQLAKPSDRKVVFRTPDRPWSLYEGYGGLCAVLGEALRRLDELIASAHSAESEARDRRYDERGGIQKGSSVMLGYCDLRLCT